MIIWFTRDISSSKFLYCSQRSFITWFWKRIHRIFVSSLSYIRLIIRGISYIQVSLVKKIRELDIFLWYRLFCSPKHRVNKNVEPQKKAAQNKKNILLPSISFRLQDNFVTGGKTYFFKRTTWNTVSLWLLYSTSPF